MSFRKPWHMPFRKLIPVFTVTVEKRRNKAFLCFLFMRCKHTGEIDQDLTRTKKVSVRSKALVVALKTKKSYDFLPFFQTLSLFDFPDFFQV